MYKTSKPISSPNKSTYTGQNLPDYIFIFSSMLYILQNTFDVSVLCEISFYCKFLLISSLSTLTVILQKSSTHRRYAAPSLSPNFPSRLKGLGGFNCIRLKVNPRSLEFAPHWRCKKCLTDIDTNGNTRARKNGNVMKYHQ